MLVQIRFPVWRELKLPLLCSLTGRVGCVFRYAFPFEGNWNLRIPTIGQPWLQVQIRFPVWRELKHNSLGEQEVGCLSSDTLSRLKGIETKIASNNTFVVFVVFRYAFPFEGNWNFSLCFDSALSIVQIRFPVWRELKLILSRTVFRTSRRFRYAFPFEGNWNRKGYTGSIFFKTRFRYAFPFEGNWNGIF